MESTILRHIPVLALSQSSCNIYREDGNKVFLKPSLHRYVNEPKYKKYIMPSLINKDNLKHLYRFLFDFQGFPKLLEMTM